ncbi:hypothetical protein D3C87_616170 [compost metagenome]
MDMTQRLQSGLLSHSLVRILQCLAAKEVAGEKDGFFVIPKLDREQFYDVCREVGSKGSVRGRDRIWHELNTLGTSNDPGKLDREVLMATGIKIVAYFYRKTGKYYAHGVVDLGDFDKLHDPDAVRERVIERQKIMAQGWEQTGEYCLVLHDTDINMQDNNYEMTVDRLYHP